MGRLTTPTQPTRAVRRSSIPYGCSNNPRLDRQPPRSLTFSKLALRGSWLNSSPRHPRTIRTCPFGPRLVRRPVQTQPLLRAHGTTTQTTFCSRHFLTTLFPGRISYVNV